MKNEINEFRGNYYFLSNFFDCPIVFENIPYLNNEAAFQAQKVLDLDTKKEFSTLPPNLAKSKGRKVNLRKDWEKVKDELMYKICLAKFTQNPKLKFQLLETKDAVLIEGNTWNDTYWGVCKGIGKNKLGEILMKIRKEFNE